ncbi:hypothetical protein ACWD5R_41165 [Streptomyces sp. NPDC002514]|uniref:hypothetical protein n=1 Tax=Streptomyces sp. NPDC001270 TaxID=3364554 RepID=UPI00367DA22F
MWGDLKLFLVLRTAAFQLAVAQCLEQFHGRGPDVRCRVEGVLELQLGTGEVLAEVPQVVVERRARLGVRRQHGLEPAQFPGRAMADWFSGGADEAGVLGVEADLRVPVVAAAGVFGQVAQRHQAGGGFSADQAAQGGAGDGVGEQFGAVDPGRPEPGAAGVQCFGRAGSQRVPADDHSGGWPAHLLWWHPYEHDRLVWSPWRGAVEEVDAAEDDPGFSVRGLLIVHGGLLRV